MADGELVGLLYCDLAGVLRGRFVRSEQVEDSLSAGVGWAPANQAVTISGELAEPNPFGSVGDLRLRPDERTRVRVDLGDEVPPLEFMLCDAVQPDGSVWDCCPRTLLANRSAVLAQESGGKLIATFEHEFQLLGGSEFAEPFSLHAVRQLGFFPQRLMGALADAGIEPEMFVAEYGPRQFEVPCPPAAARASADRSIIVREVIRETARACGLAATFAPICAGAAVGNGVHIHLSLVDEHGRSLFYAPECPGQLSALGGSFAAGILEHAGALTALTAPSAVSFERFKPHNWAASAAFLGLRDREALVRICPGSRLGGGEPARQYNLEFRAADATSNPYLALVGIINAGLDGIRRRLAPPAISNRPAHVGGELPHSLAEAIDLLTDDQALGDGWSDDLRALYTLVKKAEARTLTEMDLEERCAWYRDVV